MNTRPLSTAMLLLAIATSAPAQEGTQDFKDQDLSTRSRAEVRAELAQARAAGQLDQRGETYGSFDANAVGSTLSRAEVLADLQLWREAGLGALSHGEAGYHVFTPAYREAQARYRALRASPRYAELVQRIAQQRGEVVAATSAATRAQ